MYTQSAFGWLELKPLPGRNMIQISSHAMALNARLQMPILLCLFVVRIGAVAQVPTNLGASTSSPKEPKVLATTLINVDTGDELIMELKILNHGKEMSGATISSKRAGDGPTP